MAVANAGRYAAFSLIAAYTACGGIAEKSRVNEDDAGFGGAGTTFATSGSVTTTGTTTGAIGVSTVAGFVTTTAVGTTGGFGAGGGPSGAGGASGFVNATTGGVTTNGYAGQAGAPSVSGLCNDQCDAMRTAADELDCESPSFSECFADCDSTADLVAAYGCENEFVTWSSCIGNLGVDGFVCYEDYGVSPEGCMTETSEMIDCVFRDGF